jgi:hypothetical protein
MNAKTSGWNFAHLRVFALFVCDDVCFDPAPNNGKIMSECVDKEVVFPHKPTLCLIVNEDEIDHHDK